MAGTDQTGKMSVGVFLLLAVAVSTVFALAVAISDFSKDPYVPEQVGDALLEERMDGLRKSFESNSYAQQELLSLYEDQSLEGINWHVSPSMDEIYLRDVKEVANLVIKKAGVYNSESNGRVDVYLYDDLDELFQKLRANGVNRTAAGSLISRLKSIGGFYLYYDNLILINPESFSNRDVFLHVFAHELTHHYQKRYCSRPNWFSEGFAEFIAFKAMSEKSSVYARHYFNKLLDLDLERADLRSLEDGETSDRIHYEVSFLAVFYLLSNFEGNYYNDCGYDTSANWRAHFEDTFGLSPESFYEEFEKAKFERMG